MLMLLMARVKSSLFGVFRVGYLFFWYFPFRRPGPARLYCVYITSPPITAHIFKLIYVTLGTSTRQTGPRTLCRGALLLHSMTRPVSIYAGETSGSNGHALPEMRLFGVRVSISPALYHVCTA